ncbi:hypothetical protein K432DRAFT_445813 [Lepidopterella palustris CBS 459.81]|uniref:Ran-specific GTPase-activating protein n=1 Tax=Lepidopterella palustris CBS 459.81 TaxID=1314670 RepID=A0A8E2E3X9_9PEZI|nr:hypothetical protein K432DRAFT_445813 [Lepidopterella palustris CBS 459.81]
MDPLSIAAGSAGLAGFCFKISAFLYNFVDDTRNVDRNVSDLISEIRSLSQVLHTINKSLEDNTLVALSRNNEHLWVNVDSSLQDCKNTLEILYQMLKDLEDGGASGLGVLRKPVKQVRLNMKTKDILFFKQQVHSHYSAMQLALQTINVCIALQNNSSQQEIARQLTGLKDQIGRAMDAVALQQQESASDLSGSAVQDRRKISSNLYRLAQQAESLRSSASTVVEGSRSTVWGGSVLGEPLSQEQYQSITDWIPAAMGEDVEDKSMTSGPTSSGHTADDESNSGSDIERDLLNEFDRLATANVAKQDYPKARKYMRKAISKVESLYGSAGTTSSPLKAKLALLFCASQKWDDAETILQPMSDSKRNIEPLAMHCLHTLAIAHFDAGHLDVADRTCRRALQWKKKVLGKSHPSYFQTVDLLADICEAKEEQEESEAWRHLIPSDFTSMNNKDWFRYMVANTAELGWSIPETSNSTNAIAADDAQTSNATQTQARLYTTAIKENTTLGKSLSASAISQSETNSAIREPSNDQPDITPNNGTPPKDIIDSTCDGEVETIMFKMRSVLFLFDRHTTEWIHRGSGDVRLLKHNENKKTRLVMRSDKTLQVIANHYVLPDMRLSLNCGSDRSWVWNSPADISDGEPKSLTLAIRFLDSTKANLFKEAFNKAQEDNELVMKREDN